MKVGEEDGVGVGDFVGVTGQFAACAAPVLADVVGLEVRESAASVAGVVPDTPGAVSVRLGCVAATTGGTVDVHLAAET